MLVVFPSTFEIWDYSAFGKIALYATIAVGAIVGGATGLRQKAKTLFSRLALALMACVAVAHLTAVWTLIVDPTRGSGTVPLTPPLALLAYISDLVLLLVGPGVAAAVAANAFASSRSLRQASAAVLLGVFSVYVAYITPWIGEVIFD